MPRRFAVLTAFVAALALANERLAAVEPTAHRPDGRLLIDAQDGHLDQLTLLDAVLLASGIHNEPLQSEIRAAISGYIERLANTLDAIPHDDQRIVAIHDFLHEEVLVGSYQADCTQIARAIRDGDYNCVSATVLFQMLCQSQGIACRAVATPTHVFSRVEAGGQLIDVQTTCPSWFRLTEAQRRAFERQQIPPQDGQAREIGELELLAKIYYNRGVAHLAAARFAEAEQEFRLSLQLDPLDQAAQENLLAALNNWALALSDQAEFEQAARLLERGRAVNPDYGPLRANDLHIHQRWAQALCELGRYAEAAQILSQGAARQPDAPLFREGPVTIYRLWMRKLVDQADYEGAVRLAEQAERRFASTGAAPDALTWIAEAAEQCLAAGQSDAAGRLIAAALETRPASPRLLSMQSRLTAARP